jgi:uncharacterized protein (TIGR02271 family)
MRALSTKGEELGRVVRVDEDTFVVEKGGVDPRAYELRYRYITDVRGDDIIYAVEETVTRQDGVGFREGAEHGTAGVSGKISSVATAAREKLGLSGRSETGLGPSRGTGAAAVTGIGAAAAGLGAKAKNLSSQATGHDVRETGVGATGEEEIRISLMDEEMAIEKVSRESGHVRIRKEIRMEEKHVTVPVMVEEVVIERIPIGRQAEGTDDLAFRGHELDMPLHEEEIRVTKRPVVREELRIRKLVHSENRDATASLRHEDVKVDDSTHPEGFRFKTAGDIRSERR